MCVDCNRKRGRAVNKKILKNSLGENAVLKKRIKKYYALYAMLALPIVYFVIFKYIPILGNVLAFRKYSPSTPFFGKSWIGFEYFKMFLTDSNFYKIFMNTIILSVETLIIGFPFPIIFALLLNELHSVRFKKTVQTVSYLPHFISIVVVVSFISQLLSPSSGILNEIRRYFGLEAINYLAKPQYFRTIYIVSEQWQNMGWNAIIYIAALSGVDVQLYEAAQIDGAGKWKQMLNVTLPGIMPTIVITFILTVGNMLALGYEKVLLLMNDLNKETSDIISTYVYRLGIVDGNYSYSTAVGLFNSVIGLILVSGTNFISSRLSETSLW